MRRLVPDLSQHRGTGAFKGVPFEPECIQHILQSCRFGSVFETAMARDGFLSATAVAMGMLVGHHERTKFVFCVISSPEKTSASIDDLPDRRFPCVHPDADFRLQCGIARLRFTSAWQPSLCLAALFWRQ
jgi:hypothetical protein